MGSVTHRQWVGAQVTVAAITLEEWGERGVNMEWELGSGGGVGGVGGGVNGVSGGV